MKTFGWVGKDIDYNLGIIHMHMRICQCTKGTFQYFFHFPQVAYGLIPFLSLI
jgi:hypothetical protein